MSKGPKPFEKQVFDFGNIDRKSLQADIVNRQVLLGSGTYKTVSEATIEGDDRVFALSEFKDNFDAEDATLEYKFAYQLAKHGISSVPTYIQTTEDASRFLPTERVLAHNIKLGKGAKFLTLKLICGNDMIIAMGRESIFFTKLRELCEVLIDRTKMVYADIKKDNVCYSEREDKIKIVDVDRKFFNELGLEKGQIISSLQHQLTSLQRKLTSLQQQFTSLQQQFTSLQKQLTSVQKHQIQDIQDIQDQIQNQIQDQNQNIKNLNARLKIANNLIDTNFPYYYQDYKTHLINYMIFQTVLVGKRYVSAIDLQTAGLTELSVKAMLQFLLDTNNYFTSISEYHTPVVELTWYARRRNDKDYIKTAFINHDVNRMYRYITNPDPQAKFGGGRRRTIRQKSLRKRKSRKNGKK